MTVRPEDVVRVVEFRNRLVTFVNYVGENAGTYEQPPQDVVRHIGQEQSWLAQEYGRVYRTVAPYGIAQMSRFGGIVSQDVVRDAIGRLDHPSYPALSQMAVQQLDTVIGHLRAEVEDRPDRPARSTDDLYRLTSPLYWLGALVRLAARLLSTNRGKIAAALGAVALAIIGAVASGWAEAFFASKP
jgi:hypothetical protein